MQVTYPCPWIYNGTIFHLNSLDNHVGFVYLIEELDSNKKYIGKKLFYQTRSKKIKGRINKKRIITESDWKSYFGSNDELNNKVQNNSLDNYKRTILYLCETKSELSYYEAMEQFNRKVLFDPCYYNKFIMVRLNSNQFKNPL